MSMNRYKFSYFFIVVYLVYFILSTFIKFGNMVNFVFNILYLVMIVGYLLIYKFKINFSLILLDIFAIVALLINKNYNMYYFVELLITQSIAIIIYSYPKLFKLFIISFKIFIIMIIVKVLLGEDTNNVIVNSSENIISAYLITYLIYYNFYLKNINLNMNIKILFLCLILSIVYHGRSGIGLLFIAFINILLIKGQDSFLNFIKNDLYLIFMWIGLIGFAIYLYFDNHLVTLLFLNEGRLAIWSEYISLCRSSIESFIFGADLTKSSIILRFGNTIHNSFLQFHSQFGIIPIVLLTFGLLKCIKKTYQNEDWMLVTFLIVFLIRMIFDSYFSSITEILIFYIFVAFCKQRNKGERYGKKGN